MINYDPVELKPPKTNNPKIFFLATSSSAAINRTSKEVKIEEKECIDISRHSR